MNKNILIAAPLGIFALAALVLLFRSPVSAEAMLGFGLVFALTAIAGVEYRLNWKRILG